MTTPIPEAAVEAAAKALVEAMNYRGAVGDFEWDRFEAKSAEFATAALTAARPHMEVEALMRAAEWSEGYRDEPLTGWVVGAGLRARAATIAERTQR